MKNKYAAKRQNKNIATTEEKPTAQSAPVQCEQTVEASATPNESTTVVKKPKKQRVWEIDFLRGLSIIMVVWDHCMFDMSVNFGDAWRFSGSNILKELSFFATDYYTSELRAYGWIAFVFIFFFISGISSSFSKNNLVRGIKLAIVAGLVSLVTYVLEVIGVGNVFIFLGVLHCLAMCMLIYAVIEIIVNLFNRKKKKWALPAVLLVVTGIALTFNQIFNVSLYETTDFKTVISDCKIAGLFVYTRDWWVMTADYFPLLPFLWFYMFGAFIGKIFYSSKKSLMPKLDGKWNCVFTFAGRHSLTIYLAIQVIAITLFALITFIVTGSFV